MNRNPLMGAGRGALIGLFGGLFTGAAMFLVLVLYSIAPPDDRMGSTAALGPRRARPESMP